MKQADLFGMTAVQPARPPLSSPTNEVEKQEAAGLAGIAEPIPARSPEVSRAHGDADMTPYFVRRLAGPLQVAALVVGRIPGPRLGDDAPLAARCEAFRARLVAFRGSLHASVPPRPKDRLISGWSR
jgi:hypothetical protein